MTHMYICMYICMYVDLLNVGHITSLIYIHTTHPYTHMYVCMHVCVSTYIYTCMYVNLLNLGHTTSLKYVIILFDFSSSLCVRNLRNLSYCKHDRCMCVHVCIYACMYLCMCVCVDTFRFFFLIMC